MEDIKIRKRKDSFAEIDKLTPDPNNFWSIDLLKVLMIFLVLLDHSVPHIIVGRWYSVLWERIAIPVFMVIIGFNWGKSLSRKKDQSLRGLYSWKEYFLPKIKRFVVPFVIIYGLSLLYLLLANLFIGSDFLFRIYWPEDLPALHNPYLKFALMLPIWGPGNWFVPMLFLLILIFPLFYKLFTAKPWTSWIMLLVSYAIEIPYQMLNNIAADTGITYWVLNIFTFIPLQLLTAITLGIWLSIDHKWGSPRNLVIWFFGLASMVWIIYVIANGYPDFVWEYNLIYFDYNYFVYPYSALIVMLFLNIVPKSPQGKNFRNITTLSKATYHDPNLLLFDRLWALLEFQCAVWFSIPAE